MAQRTDTLDRRDDNVARPHPLLRGPTGADAGGRAGCDDVAGLEGYALADISNQFIDLEQHIGGVATLLLHTVDRQAEVERLRNRTKQEILEDTMAELQSQVASLKAKKCESCPHCP